MTISEALEKINKAYIPGVVSHYAGMKVDLWQRAHDELERAYLSTEDEQIRDTVTQAFLHKCLNLIDRFKLDGTEPISPSPADGFQLADVGVREYSARKQKHCWRCESKSDLKIVPAKSNPTSVTIECRSCLERAG